MWGSDITRIIVFVTGKTEENVWKLKSVNISV